jgi:phenylpyruvate tautomerase PptA (4-oxalocrotonate tautomerase family)
VPVLDVERVLPAGVPAAPNGLAQTLADAAGRVFCSKRRQTWVRLRALDTQAYAENDVALDRQALPVFVTVLHAHPPVDEALQGQVEALTQALAGVLGCDATCVHVQIAPAAAGRQAFGGTLLR